MTIPEQLAAAQATILTMTAAAALLETRATTAEGSLATLTTSAAADKLALEARITVLTGEKTTLATQLATANASITAKDGELATLNAAEKDLAKRADARATEIMAAVGQTRPVVTQPITKPGDETKATVSATDAVAASYRDKYGIN